MCHLQLLKVQEPADVLLVAKAFALTAHSGGGHDP